MIAGRYQPLEAARPGMPLRARDQQTAQTVLLREIADVSEDARRRALTARGIFHPSLLTLFDVTDLPNRTLLLAYEYVQAQSLRLVSGGQPFHARRATELMTEIADAIAELHAHDVIHGAITMDTVMVTMKGKAKLDRAGDPSLQLPEGRDEGADIRGVLAILRELTGGRTSTPVNRILVRGDSAITSAATLAASLRAASGRFG